MKGHLFKEYVRKKFFSDLYEAAENYVLGNYDDLYLPTKHVTNIGRVELEDATIERVFVNDLPDTRISFDVGMSLDLNVFEVVDIVLYEAYGNIPKSLSDTLIPCIRCLQQDKKEIRPRLRGE